MADMGITAKQESRIVYLVQREAGNTKSKSGKQEGPLTPNMVEELAILEHAKANPELPSGAKTILPIYSRNVRRKNAKRGVRYKVFKEPFHLPPVGRSG